MRRALIAGGVFVGLCVLLLAALHTRTAKQAVLSRVTAYLATQQIDAHADLLDYNLLGQAVTLDNVVIRGRDLPEAPPFARIARITLNLSLRDALAGRYGYIIRNGSITSPRVHLLVDEQGRTNLPRFSESESTSSETPDFLIERFTVTNARLRYEDRRQQLAAFLPISSLTITGDPATHRHRLQVTAGQGTAPTPTSTPTPVSSDSGSGSASEAGHVTLQGRTAPIDRIDGELQFDKASARIERFDLTSAGSTVSLAGDLSEFSDPRYDVALTASLDITRIAAFAGFSEPVGGIVRADIRARGPFTDMAIRTTLQGDGLSFRTLDRMQLAAEATYDVPARQARLVRLDVTSPAGRVSADGLIALDDRAGESTLNAALHSLDLGRVSQVMALPYAVASRVDGQVRARWPGLEYAQATGDARLTLTPTSTSSRRRSTRNTVALAGNVAASATASGRDVTVDLRALRGLGATLDGRVTLADRERLGGTLQARAEDLGAVVSAAEAFLGRPAGTLVGSPVSGALAADATLGGTIQSPLVRTTIDAPSVSAGGLTGVALRAQASYTPTAVEVEQADIAWDTARIHAAGHLGLTRAQPIALDLTADQLSIASLLAALNRRDIAATGQVSLRAQVQGTVKKPAGTASLAATDLRMQEEELGSVTMNVEMRDGRAQVRAEAPKFEATANASIGTTAPYPTTAEVVVADLDLASLPVKLDTPIAGTIRARLNGTADLSNPTAGTATATVEHLAIKYNDQPIETDGPAIVRYADRQLTIDRLTVRALQSTVSASGTLPLDEFVPARADTGSGAPRAAATPHPSPLPAGGAREPSAREGAIRLDARLDLASLTAYAPPDLGMQAQGGLAVEGTIRGTLRHIDPALTLTVGGASLSAKGLQPGLTGVGARVDTANGTLRITDFRAAWGPARFEASGSVPFSWLPETLPVGLPRPQEPARVQASLTGLDLATLPNLPEALTGPDGLTGTVSLRLDAEAPKPDATTLTGRVTFPELQLGLNKLTLAQQGTSTIAIDRGDVRVEQFTLDGTVGRLDVTGRVGLTGTQPLDIRTTAKINAAALASVTNAVRIAGETTAEITATGTIPAPALQGFLQLADGRIAMQEPRIAAQRLNARIDFTPERATLARLDGSLNGGTLSGSGGVDLAGGTPRNLDVRIKATDVALDEPLNLRSLTNADLHLTQRADDLIVGGQVTIQEAGLTDDINLDTGVFAALTAPRSLDLTATRSPFVERVRFDVKVNTATPVIVDNNLARAEIDADLRLLGTPYETGLSGRMDLAEGSELILNERTYEVERGVITFVDDRSIQPSLDLRIKTTARNYDITLAASGTPDDTETTLTSTPPLPEPDILALLVTGRTLDEMRGEEFEVAQSQVLSYVGGRVGSTLGRGLERATGLSTVRVEPTLIANEADPGARLTVGQDLTEDVSLVYSTDLVNSSDQIWVAEYDVTRQFMTRAVRQSDDSYRFDFRHDVRFGGQPEPRRVARRPKGTVGTVTIAGQPGLGAAEVQREFKLKAGDHYDFFSLRSAVRSLNEHYREQGYLESRVRVDRLGPDGTKQAGAVVPGQRADLTLQINAGPRVHLGFEGYQPPKKVVERARTIWHRGVFDTQRLDDVRDALRVHLVEDRYLNPKIDYVLDPEAGDERGRQAAERHVIFRIDPGVRFEQVRLVFEGARGIEPDDLEQLIKEQKLGAKVFTDPDSVTDLLTRVYRERGFLATTLEAPRYEFEEATREARVIVPVQEGPQFKIRRVNIAGNRVHSTSALLADIPLKVGDPYLPATSERSLTRLRRVYWAEGYNDVKSTYQLALDREAGVVDVQLNIAEGQRSVVAGVDIQGNQRTSDRLIRGQLEVPPGKPLDLSALGRSRKNLYDTGAFSLVDITREEAGAAGGGAAAGSTSAGAAAAAATPPESGDKPVRLNVAVREVQPFQIRYGALFDTERGVGGILDISNHNSLGKARVVGLRSRYDSQTREARLYMSQPSLRSLPLETIASLYYVEERILFATLSDEAFNVDRMGLSIQQEKKLRNAYVWSYGYRFERSRSYEPELVGPKPPLQNVSPLTSTLSRDTRDEPLDATRGSFTSHAFSFSPTWLGSDVRYTKYFGQYFHYFPLRPPQRKRFTDEIIRPRLVYATGVRFGLASGLSGLAFPLTERFLAGGSSTLRGFAQNGVGPIGPDGDPLGGEALFVLNNELRFPLIGIVDGVVFADVGNVFERVSDFTLSDLREAGGLGVRLRTPWFLVRVDYGIPLDHREGEAKSRVFFSIGQAF